jgi:glycosyltransferase involved in cell wall biosynthesis
MKFIAVQTGARRGYVVPAILQKAGMLERFYTDLCGNVGVGRWLARGARLPGIGSRLQRLAGRQVPADIRDQTRSFSSPDLRWCWRAAWAARDPTTRFRLDSQRSLELGRSAARAGFGEATHLYAMLTEFSPLMIAAKEQGLQVVSEVYILISTERLMAEERRHFPDWEAAQPDWDAVRRELLSEDVLFTRADHYICPSESVRDDLVQQWGVSTERTMMVPYGINRQWLDLEPKPRRGRVLFVGAAELRKGIHYLAMAAKQLVSRGRNYEFRVAGHASEQVRRHPMCRPLTFLGRVPRDRIHEEFQHADVFAHPSLAEGSAEATYQAMAAGVPLVTTKAAGSVARDGLEGRIVPERNLQALADALEQIVEDRAARDRMGHAARERVRDYTWECYGKRLLGALQGLSK